MAEETTITPDGSSPPETTTGTVGSNPGVRFTDDPDTPEIEGDEVEAKTTLDGDTDGDDDRFDKNPKFQERLQELRDKQDKADKLAEKYEKLISEANSASKASDEKIAELTAKIEALTRPAEKLDFDDITQMGNETLRERFDTDPISVLANYGRQLRHEMGSHKAPSKEEIAKEVAQMVIGELSSASKKMSAQKAREDFASKNKDFKDKLPEIKKLMASNPNHNEMSAYYELKSKDSEADIEKKVEERIKERDAKAIADGAKNANKPVEKSKRPAPKIAGAVPDEVVNPQKYGLTSDQGMLKMLKNFRTKKGGK